MSTNAIKKAVGYKAAELVQDGMHIGLGTGTTVFFFIERLIQRCQEGLKIHALASSRHSLALASKGKIPMLNGDETLSLDLTVDGADEIDPQKRMIKGGGGALLKEKILANMSKEMIVIVDETKLVTNLGKHKLPVEILPFAKNATLHQITKVFPKAELRKNADHSLFVTDSGNLIVDIHFSHLRQNPEEDQKMLSSIPGVLETGYFFNLAGRVIVGFSDGQVVIKP